jgi:N-methylhydantoinase B
VYVDLISGARGAGPWGDGPEGVPHPGSNNANTPAELIESEYPLRVEQYGLVPDSGGAGQFRGALAQVREIRLLEGEAVLQLRSDKRRFPPFGLPGGWPGTPSSNTLNADAEPTPAPEPAIDGDVAAEPAVSAGRATDARAASDARSATGTDGTAGPRDLPTMGMAAIRAGDSLRHVMAGGGGWGDPLKRDPAAVLADLRDEKITPGYAREVYGVMVDLTTCTIDEAATLRERASRR